MAVNAFGGRLAVFTNGQTHGHPCAAAAFGVAASAASATNTTGGLFTTATRVETFSSDGPRRIFYNVDGTPITPGNILYGTNGGIVRQKPDITAADGVNTSGNSLGAGLNPFSGTSAAAPHAGAIAAIIKSSNPSLTPSQIRTILTTTAIDVETAGVDPTAGFGILNANAAMAAAQAIQLTEQADLTLGTVTVSEGSFKNNDGVIDPGEFGNIVVQLNNPSLTAANNVNATITTGTPGITVIQGSAAYGTIASAGSATNAGAPFVIGVSQLVPCGTVINLTLSVTLANGTPLQFPLTVNVGSLPTPISATFATPATGVGFTSLTGSEALRLTQVNPASTCGSLKATPVTAPGPRRFDAYTFTNTSANSQCVSVSITSSSNNSLRSATYGNGGFNPAAITTNYLGDSGTSVANAYAFNVPAGQSFTTVIFEQNANGGNGVTYTMNVALSTCTAGLACAPVNITTNTIATGATGSSYSQSFAATGGTGNYNFALVGSLPAGLSFSGNSLSGTPTQAGSFPLTLNVTDAAGCPPGTKNYTLVIAGNSPSTITVTAGNNQTVLPGATFPTALKATVRDVSNNPLPGVAVTFAARPAAPAVRLPPVALP